MSDTSLHSVKGYSLMFPAGHSRTMACCDFFVLMDSELMAWRGRLLGRTWEIVRLLSFSLKYNQPLNNLQFQRIPLLRHWERYLPSWEDALSALVDKQPQLPPVFPLKKYIDMWYLFIRTQIIHHNYIPNQRNMGMLGTFLQVSGKG